MNSVSTIPRDGEVSAVDSQSLATSEASRTLGEIQAMLTVAAARPRNEIKSIQRIKNACERQRLAESSEYSYSKGGQKINGATIRLLEVIGQNWGNMTWGFRELSQVQGKESTVQAYAWDLESNVKITRDFVVPHSYMAKGMIKSISDPREIYELVANQAQRRVRTCLENCIPRDIVEDAVDACRKTLVAKCEITPETTKKMANAFKDKFGVYKTQIEKRIQRNLDAIEPAQFLSLRRIFVSLDTGMSEVSDWFDAAELPASKLTEQLKGESASNGTPDKPGPKAESDKPAEAPQEITESIVRDSFEKAKTLDDLEFAANSMAKQGAEMMMVDQLYGEYSEPLKPAAE